MAVAMLAVLMICFTPLAQAAQTSPAFDHSRTGFLLKDVHATLKCEQCHVDGIFKNTPKECAGCHTTGTRVAATPKPINHVPTTSSCDTCHISAANFLVKSYKHVGITGNCATCHNGQSLGVLSKPANHFPTLLPCESCHTNTSTFLSWRMDHTGLTAGCAQCHAGQFVGVVNQNTFGNHIPTNGLDCSSCHVGFSTFLGALYNHAGVLSNSCDTCHNGSYPGVKTKSATHIPTPAGTFCDTCHNQTNTNGYTSFLGALFHTSYVATSGSCYSCHNGAYIAANAQPKPATHIPNTPANQSCDACHTNGSYTSFSAGGFHTIAANNVLIASGPCSTCHNGSYTAWTSSNGMYPQAKIAAHITTTADCYTCHTSLNTSTYTTFLGAGFHGVAANNVGIAGTCGTSCHNTVGGTNASGAQGHPNTTVHNSVGANCDLCHTVALTLNYTTFLGATFTHTAPIGVCSTCHDGSTATGKPATHIPTAAACNQCHALPPPSGSATSFIGATFHLVAANNTAAIGVCQTCHTGSYTTYPSFNGLVPQAQSVPHIPATGSCDACHTSLVTTYGSATGFLGAVYNHAGVAAGGCATCHSGAYPGVSSKTYCYSAGAACPIPGSFAHQATSAPCDQCHNTGASQNYTTWANAGYAHSGADATKCANSGCHAPGGAGKGLSANHFPTTLSCDSGGCHTYTTGTFAGGQLVHSVVTTMRCDSCHNGAYSAFGSTGALPKVSNHIPTGITGSLDCNTCHKGINPQTAAASTGGTALWAKGAQPGETMNHNGAQGGAPNYCVTCHLSGVTYLGTMQKKSHNGSSTSKDCSSSSCHAPIGRTGATYTNWGG